MLGVIWKRLAAGRELRFEEGKGKLLASWSSLTLEDMKHSQSERWKGGVKRSLVRCLRSVVLVEEGGERYWYWRRQKDIPLK